MLRAELAELEKSGTVIVGSKSRYELTTRTGKHLAGTLKYHPNGNAWFYPDATDEGVIASGIDLQIHSRIHIPRRDAGTALDGDRVLVSLRSPAPQRRPAKPPQRGAKPAFNQEPEIRAHVEKVVSRRSGRIIGTFRRKNRNAWVEAQDAAFSGSIELLGDTTAQPGQLVVVELDHWQGRMHDPRGRIIEVLGWPGDRGADIAAIIHRYGLRTSFPDEVMREAPIDETPPDATETARRKDWRDKLVITIDPEDAKDHDDAIHVEKTANGWRLAVHIADVSHYVKPGSQLDREARERGNSTYLVDRVLPMLPTSLSNGICSLKPHVDRLTKCVVMEITSQGETRSSRFCDAIIHSRAKLSYEQAQTILVGKPAPDGSAPGLEDIVRESWKLAAALRKRRFHRGALDLDMAEVRIRLDEEGKPVSVDPVPYNESHQLVEECMLAANEAVAAAITRRGRNTIHRIHEDPDFSRLFEFGETARAHGYQPGDLTQRSNIQKLLDSAKGRPDEHAIKLGLLKSLKRAAYSAPPLGHYGLAKTDYCHFTSPIRRYADLIVHRALQPLLENPPKHHDPTPTEAELMSIARHLSDTERVSADAENESRQIKLLEYLEACAKSATPPIFEGIVTDVRAMGLMVEATGIGARGVIKREDLPGGHWRFEAHRMAYVSYDGRSIQLGQRISLRVSAVDFERRFTDFVMAGEPPADKTSPPSGKKQAPKPARKQDKPRKFKKK